ncbi:NAD(P)-dependent oxidoreductase, partial [Thioclava sp.]|uniref:NAD(P)-dependent oxidoreductase n=1 Tax=Thioclava sp. TaxID=1933450 RepID=UPI003242535D
RGGLVDEAAVKDLLESGHIKAAAFDVFAVEPAKENILFGTPNFIATPHLGAATTEAQENVALQVAEQMSDYLLSGAVTNALNMPSITAEEAPRIKPFAELAEKLGSFAGQISDFGYDEVVIEYEGEVADLNRKPLTAALLAGLLRASRGDVNMVSAPVIAKERGIQISTTSQDQTGIFEGYIKVTVVSESKERSIAGTVFSDGKPRFIQIKGINIDAEVGEHMLYTTNDDVPGIIGKLGTILGEKGVNLANFTLGRSKQGGEAIAIAYVDEAVGQDVVDALKTSGGFKQVKPLEFVLG